MGGMASLTCALSNEVPDCPVVSPVSGQVYERRLIEKYVTEAGVDPINKEPLSIEQLIEVKCSPLVKPKPPSATSIPAILKSLQDEWDAVMLHSFTLRQQLQTARQELSHALYQHDAACRVIARLNKKVTAAREALATLKPQAVAGTPLLHTPSHAPPTPGHDQTQAVAAGGASTQEATGMTGDIVEKLQEKATVLTQERKRRGKTVPEDLCTAEKIKEFVSQSSHPGLHSASVPGILSVDISPADSAKILTGGADKNATGDYVLTTSTDQHWAFSDIRAGRLVTRVQDPGTGQGPVALTCAQFHPDGLIFGTGTADAQIKIWDLKEQSNVANFPGHAGQISALSFSENGYYLATAADDSCVKLWDLRKLKNFKTLQLEDGYEVRDLCFDSSGTYLAVAGSDVRVYLCKQWNELKVMNDHTAAATGVRFGENSQYIASTSMDRTLKIYGNQ